ncbi:7487_t:CDS:2 [Paraglomus brasilianum]|uniref:7487_t:CDS:1 n=1 Tax=Paraglomus brasilianum TaxID=144538 RepID=A0A9N8Z5R3_9GLOM|nr:7487_t:CDS:2 [Paraglomus brasilianum]
MSSSIPIYYQVSGRNISVVKLKEGENLINFRQTIVNNEALDIPDSTLILSATTPDTEIQINNDDYFKIQCGKSLQKLVELLYNNDDNPIRVNSVVQTTKRSREEDSEHQPTKRSREEDSEHQPTKRSQEEDSEHQPTKYLHIVNIPGTNMYKTTDNNINMQEVHPNVPHSIPDFLAFRNTPNRFFCDKTKYIRLLEAQQPDYKILFLRPRQFGKSTLVSTLAAYYDVHTKNIFQSLFGGLDIGENPTRWANQHLVLLLNLSSVETENMNIMRNSFNRIINKMLKFFIKKYAEELGYPDINELIDETASESFLNIFNLVRDRKKTLFIAVDEYDRPGNRYLQNGGIKLWNPVSREHFTSLEDFFDANLFSALKLGCGGEFNRVIHKLFITGITPMFQRRLSSIANFRNISTDVKFHSACGFFDEDIKGLVEEYLVLDEEDKTVLLDVLKHSCDGYLFCKPGADTIQPVYNPLLVFNALERYNDREYLFELISGLSDATHFFGMIARHNLIKYKDLITLYSGEPMQAEFNPNISFSEVLSAPMIGHDASCLKTACSLLYYLGVLTHHSQGGLIVPNQNIQNVVIAQLIEEQCANNFAGTTEDRERVYQDLLDGTVNSFIEIMKNYFRSESTRDLQTVNERALKSALLSLIPFSGRASELCLMADSRKCYGEGRYKFPDLFVTKRSILDTRTLSIVVELKLFSLLGLLSGEAGSWCSNFTASQLDNFNRNLESEGEGALLKRKYIPYNRAEVTTIGDVLNSAITQLENYMSIIAMGPWKKLSNTEFSGVHDIRVGAITNRIGDFLDGYVILAVGTRRFIVRQLDRISVNVCYYVLQS